MANIAIVDKKEEWDAVVASFEHSDFYHTYEYHNIARNENDHPFLIKYTEGDKSIALPLLLREIPGSLNKDATSVYGYPGPLTKNISVEFDNNTFIKQIRQLFLEMNIVSVFSRLNPFIPYQDIPLKNIGKISFSGKIVNIDITKDLDVQKKHYNRRLKSYINKSRELYTVKLATTNYEIEEFISLYYENMRRVNASKSYFFPKDYFIDLINCDDFKTEILLAVDNETNSIIAGAMFIKKNNIVQYHLSGSNQNYLHLNPTKMLIDEMRIISTQENFQYYNLGGGVHSCEDSLFRFKSSFSKDFKDFKLWKYIVNEPVYEKLTHQNILKEKNSGNNGAKIFFPSYRYSNNS